MHGSEPPLEPSASTQTESAVAIAEALKIKFGEDALAVAEEQLALVGETREAWLHVASILRAEGQS